jgi:hypothetical protein
MAADEALWNRLGTLGLVAILGAVHRFDQAPEGPRPGGLALDRRPAIFAPS